MKLLVAVIDIVNMTPIYGLLTIVIVMLHWGICIIPYNYHY